jgi:hypothetical protein
MSDDPETARQIAELARGTQPLVVLDVDEVLLEFIRPFVGFLGSNGLKFDTASFRLNGNISEAATGNVIDNDRVTALIDDFFAVQADWQTAADGAAEAIASLAANAEVVMLTAMPHRHRARRRAHLDALGFPYPLVTTEKAKGPAIRALRGEEGRPVAFVDDLPVNLVSVRGAVADAHLFHVMAHAGMRKLLPPLPEGIVAAEGWHDAAPKIAAALGLEG